MKMEQTECSKTSAFKIQMPGNNPKESIQHSEHGESLKSRKPYAVGQHSKFVKGIDRADRYLSLDSFLRKTVKWSKNVLYPLNCALFNAFLCTGH